MFADKAGLGAGVVAWLQQRVATAVADHGRFIVAFSGGSLPAIVGLGLSDDAAIAALHPDKWTVVFADERCVPLDHEDSNYAAVKKHCLDKVRCKQEGDERQTDSDPTETHERMTHDPYEQRETHSSCTRERKREKEKEGRKEEVARKKERETESTRGSGQPHLHPTPTFTLTVVLHLRRAAWHQALSDPRA